MERSSVEPSLLDAVAGVVNLFVLIALVELGVGRRPALFEILGGMNLWRYLNLCDQNQIRGVQARYSSKWGWRW